MTAVQQTLEVEHDRQDSGTHADLITRGGQYAEFWSQRASATGWLMVGSATR
jgi:ATP-binding cassette, subfamily B, bacterial IrtB/YbtQ